MYNKIADSCQLLLPKITRTSETSMNKALFLCVAAAFLYATEIVVANKFLKPISPLVLTLGVALVISACSAICITHRLATQASNQTEAEKLEALDEEKLPIAFPTKEQLAIIFLLGLLNFLADWSHYAAIKSQAGGAVLATFYILIPVFSKTMGGEWPSLRLLSAWVLGGLLLYLLKEELAK